MLIIKYLLGKPQQGTFYNCLGADCHPLIKRKRKNSAYNKRNKQQVTSK